MQLSKSLQKEELYENLFRSLDQRFGDDADAPPFHEWVNGITLDNNPFTYDRHEYLLEPYQDDHPHQTEMKAAQLGLTTRAMLRSLYKCRYAGFRGVLYLFPSRTATSGIKQTPLSNPDRPTRKLSVLI